jgi:hypothetical protein
MSLRLASQDLGNRFVHRTRFLVTNSAAESRSPVWTSRMRSEVRCEQETAMSDQDKAAAVERADQALGKYGAVAADVLERLWDESFEQGRLAALNELQDRFCVCMK